jgi:cell division protease FtsH
MVMTEEEKKLTAYHEAGHAIVALNIAESDPIHKATIIPRGQALGMVMRLPTRDRLSVSRVKLEADLSVAAGGRIAEEMIFGPEKVTTGASADSSQATKMARRMILECGMSEKLGFLSYASDGAQEVFLGHSTSASKNISSSTAKIIDEEIRALIDKTYNRAKEILKDNKKALELLALGLLEHETLTGDDIKKIVDGQQVVKQKKIPIVRTSKKSKMPSSEYVDAVKKSPRGRRTVNVT